MTSKIKKIREEYGSLRQAVEHYAGMRCSRAMTAEALGIHRKTLRGFCKRMDIDHLFVPRKEMLPECRSVGHPSRGAANRRRLGDRRVTDEQLLAEVVKYRTTREFNRNAHYNIGTVYARLGSWPKARALAREKAMAEK